MGEKIAKHWERNPRTPGLCDGWPNPVVDHGDQVRDAVFNSQKLVILQQADAKCRKLELTNLLVKGHM